MDIGKMGRKLRTIEKLKADAEARGEQASEIVVIDARRQVSASKRYPPGFEPFESIEDANGDAAALMLVMGVSGED